MTFSLPVVLATAVLQLALEYGVAQPVSAAAQGVVASQKRMSAFRKAVHRAYQDLRASDYATLTLSFLDEWYLAKKAVTHELLNGILIASQVDYDRLQQVYAQSFTGDAPDVRPALKFLVQRTHEHLADLDPVFRECLKLSLHERELSISEQQLAVQSRMLALVERLGSTLTEPPRSLPGTFVPSPRCREVLGRQRLALEVSTLLKRRETPMIALSGGPGYGKTELARQVAQTALAMGIFDDVLWVTAKDAEFFTGATDTRPPGQSLSWDDLVQEYAVQLGCAPGEVRRLVRQKSLLMVLDNAETADAGDILPRLGSLTGSSQALITSRETRYAPYIASIETPGLGRSWSHRLLRDEARFHRAVALIDATEEQLDRIYELSCGAPLALHFVVGRAYQDRDLTPVLEELASAGPEVATFYEYCLGTAWRRISDAARQVLRYMSHMAVGSVAVDELVHPWDLKRSRVQSALAELRSWFLIEVSASEGRGSLYDLHPWVRKSIRAGLVDDWKPSVSELEGVAQWKMQQLKRWTNRS